MSYEDALDYLCQMRDLYDDPKSNPYQALSIAIRAVKEKRERETSITLDPLEMIGFEQEG